MHLLADAASAGNGFITLVVLLGIGALLLHPFKRRVGGIDPKTGKPGGAEKGIIGVIWVLAAIATGIYISR